MPRRRRFAPPGRSSSLTVTADPDKVPGTTDGADALGRRSISSGLFIPAAAAAAADEATTDLAASDLAAEGGGALRLESGRASGCNFGCGGTGGRLLGRPVLAEDTPELWSPPSSSWSSTSGRGSGFIRIVLGACSAGRPGREAPGFPNMLPKPLPPVLVGFTEVREADDLFSTGCIADFLPPAICDP